MFGGLAVDLNLLEAAAPLDKSHTLLLQTAVCE